MANEKCPYCTSTLSHLSLTWRSLEDHIQVCKLIQPYVINKNQCSLCLRMFKAQTRLYNHFRMRHPEIGDNVGQDRIVHHKLFQCPKCDIAFKTQDDVKGHLMFEKDTKVVISIDKNPGRELLYTRVGRAGNVYHCLKCKISSNCKGSFLDHLKIQHNKEFNEEDMIKDNKAFKGPPEILTPVKALNKTDQRSLEEYDITNDFNAKQSREFCDSKGMDNLKNQSHVKSLKHAHVKSLQVEKEPGKMSDLMFKCPVCLNYISMNATDHLTSCKKFSNFAELKDLSCKICGRNYETRGPLFHHIGLSHCFQIDKYLKVYQDHFKKNEGQGSDFENHIENLEVIKRQPIMKKLIVIQPKALVKCPVCFNSVSIDDEEHLNACKLFSNFADIPNLTCKVCQMDFKFQNFLFRHIRVNHYQLVKKYTLDQEKLKKDDPRKSPPQVSKDIKACVGYDEQHRFPNRICKPCGPKQQCPHSLSEIENQGEIKSALLEKENIKPENADELEIVFETKIKPNEMEVGNAIKFQFESADESYSLPQVGADTDSQSEIDNRLSNESDLIFDELLVKSSDVNSLQVEKDWNKGSEGETDVKICSICLINVSIDDEEHENTCKILNNFANLENFTCKACQSEFESQTTLYNHIRGDHFQQLQNYALYQKCRKKDDTLPQVNKNIKARAGYDERRWFPNRRYGPRGAKQHPYLQFEIEKQEEMKRVRISQEKEQIKQECEDEMEIVYETKTKPNEIKAGNTIKSPFESADESYSLSEVREDINLQSEIENQVEIESFNNLLAKKEIKNEFEDEMDVVYETKPKPNVVEVGIFKCQLCHEVYASMYAVQLHIQLFHNIYNT